VSRPGIYVQVFERITTPLLGFSGSVQDRLERALQGEGLAIGREAGSAMAAHAKSGRMLGSLKVRTKRYKLSVWTSVSMGGTRSSRHAHLFERGYDGVETVRAHERVSRFGNKFTVKDYRRQVSYKPHLPLEHGLDRRRSSVRAAVMRAIGEAADEGLSS
jgi:hypothetical protein